MGGRRGDFLVEEIASPSRGCDEGGIEELHRLWKGPELGWVQQGTGCTSSMAFFGGRIWILGKCEGRVHCV